MVAIVCAFGVVAGSATARAATRAAVGPSIELPPSTPQPPPPPAQPAPSPAQPTSPLWVGVIPELKAQPLPAGFVGLSLEYRTVLTYAGTNPNAINPVLVHLIQNLTPGQAPILRIGGDSTDWSWWPVPDLERPPGVTYAITPAWVATARALAQALNARYILGVNLEAGSPTVEQTEARELLTGIGWPYVDAVELGNEPELYSVLPWYKLATGEGVPGRPPSYDFLAFNNELAAFHEAEPWIPLAGPSSGSYAWLQSLPALLIDSPWLRMVTVHSYWLNKCARSPEQRGYPTLPHLLDARPPSRMTANLAVYAAMAHAAGIPIRIDEMNSVTCGGERGVSNVFASALWALNALFEAAGAGVDGVNIHTFPGTANQLFSFTDAAGTWSGTVSPEYYGLLMFTKAMPPGARMLRIFEPAADPVRAWATLGTDGTIRVVLINDSITNSRTVVVQLPPEAQLQALLAPGKPAPSPTEPGQLTQLLAPNVDATSGITLGGQSVGTRTTTGVLSGTPATTAITPRAAGAYTVSLPAASAAMLTLAPGPGVQPG